MKEKLIKSFVQHFVKQSGGENRGFWGVT